MAHMIPALVIATALTTGDASPPEPAAEQAPPARVILGVDCSKPLTISLPDDVLIDCEQGESR